jgi:hypothetical protein
MTDFSIISVHSLFSSSSLSGSVVMPSMLSFCSTSDVGCTCLSSAVLVNGHLNNDEEECKETVPVECEEDSQQVTLIKELK